MQPSFVPRPIYRVKAYGYLAEAGDTAEGIATKFGRPASDYRELVAANIEGRRLMPQPLGSPYGARTFAELEEGESLKIPAHWQDPVGLAGEPSMLGSVQVPDGIVQGIGDALSHWPGAGQVDPSMLPAVTNATVQWWTNTYGTQPASVGSEYLPFLGSAAAWVRAFGPQIAQQAGGAAGVANFPWASFLAWLPTTVNPTQIDWEKCAPGSASAAGCSIPGTNSIPWAAIPWGYLATIGAGLEKVKPAPVAVDWANADPAAVAASLKTAIDTALAGANLPTAVGCGLNSIKGTDGACYCLPGYQWAAPYNPAYASDCAPIAPSQDSPATACAKAGGSFDAATGTCRAPRPAVAPAAPTAPTAPTGMNPWLIGAAVVGAVAVIGGAVAVGMASMKGRPRTTSASALLPAGATRPRRLREFRSKERGGLSSVP